MLSIRQIGVIGRTYRHINRYRNILKVLFEYGFGDLIDSLKIDQYIEIGLKLIPRKKRKNIERLNRPQRIRKAIEELGPTFIKLGQIVSTRPDIIPIEYIKELEKLQDDVPPFDFKEVQKIIESDLDRPINDIFDSIDPIPIAAASLGQVHKAIIKGGKEVVIKVQRPNIQRIIEVDLEIISHITGLMEKHIEEMEIHRPTLLVDRFARQLEDELSYKTEALNMERFGAMYDKSNEIIVPRVYKSLSGEKVLTMEYIEGTKISDLDRIVKRNIDLKNLGKIISDSILNQIFTLGFFHGDPHPGNIVVTNSGRIAFLDFGMMGRISREDRELFSAFLMSIINKNERKLVSAALKLVNYSEEPDRDELQHDLGDFIEKHMFLSLKDINVSKILYEIVDILTKHSLRLKPHIFLMMKSLTTAEGIGRQLNPDFEIIAAAEPFVKKVELSKLDPLRTAEELFDSSLELASVLRDIPIELQSILKQTREGRIKMEFHHKGLDEMLKTHDRLSNRIAFSIVLASLIVGSSLIILSKLPPLWFDIPIIGLAGYIIAGLMGLTLLVSIIRHGKM